MIRTDLSTKEWLTTHRQVVARENSVDTGEAEGYHMGAAVGAASHYRRRENGVIRMYFVDPRSASEELNVSGAMSALKLDDPFDLSPTPYNQAMMLSLLWQRNPERIYVAGFAGGRIPLMFYHYFPQAVIESTDIDAEVTGLADVFLAFSTTSGNASSSRTVVSSSNDVRRRRHMTSFSSTCFEAWGSALRI